MAASALALVGSPKRLRRSSLIKNIGVQKAQMTVSETNRRKY